MCASQECRWYLFITIICSLGLLIPLLLKYYIYPSQLQSLFLVCSLLSCSFLKFISNSRVIDLIDKYPTLYLTNFHPSMVDSSAPITLCDYIRMMLNCANHVKLLLPWKEESYFKEISAPLP